MANKSIKRFLNGFSSGVLKKEESYRKLVGGILNRYQWSKAENRAEGNEFKEKDYDKLRKSDSRISKYSFSEDDLSNSNRWMPEIDWVAKALEPALQFYKWALPTGNGIGDKPPPTNRSIAEIFASIQRSKLGLQDWSISDLTIGLYLIYLQQASTSPVEDLKGEIISSESIVQDLIYHVELAKGCYRDNAAGLARNSMLRESNVLKFIKNSSVLRPGYYIGIDMRNKLVILGIRGTHTVYDVITDIVSSSHEEVTFEGYSTHFGTAEAARWFLTHEIETIRKCLEKHKIKACGSFTGRCNGFFTCNDAP